MDIVPATVDDAEALFAVQYAAYEGEQRLYPHDPLPPLQQTLDDLREVLRTMTVLKAVEGGRIVGSVRGRMRDDGTCCIGRLVVHPDMQDRGIGTRLMHAIEAAFPQARRYELFTGHLSARNLYLYRKLGYTEAFRSPESPTLELVYLEKERRP